MKRLIALTSSILLLGSATSFAQQSPPPAPDAPPRAGPPEGGPDIGEGPRHGPGMRHGPGGPSGPHGPRHGPRGEAIEGMGFVLSIGPRRLVVQCGDTDFDRCVQSSQPLVDAFRDPALSPPPPPANEGGSGSSL